MGELVSTPWYGKKQGNGRVTLYDGNHAIIGIMDDEIHANDAISSHNLCLEKITATMTPDKHVLLEAEDIIHGQRRTDYGTPKESFIRVWKLWSPIMESQLPGIEKAAMCLLLLKVARYTQSRDRDSIVDMAGYAGCLAQLRGWED